MHTTDIPQPTITLVFEVLRKCASEWFTIGTYLGVSVYSLNSFRGGEHKHRPILDCLISTINCWINESEDVSWEKLAQALDKCNLTDTATTVRKKYIQQDASSAYQNRIEIQPDVTIIKTLQSLEMSFSCLLIKLEDLHRPEYTKKGILFFNTLFGTKMYGGPGILAYEKSSDILQELSNDHLDTFNIDYLRQYVSIFDNEEMVKVTDEYEEKKEQFLSSAAVRDFQQAVVSKVESLSTEGVFVITVPKYYANNRTLADIVKLALLGLEDSNKPQVRVKASVL